MKTITCKKCQTPNLVWKNTGSAWRLYESNGSMHSCSKSKKFIESSPEVQKLSELVADLLIRVSNLENKIDLKIEQLDLFGQIPP